MNISTDKFASYSIPFTNEKGSELFYLINVSMYGGKKDNCSISIRESSTKTNTGSHVLIYLSEMPCKTLPSIEEVLSFWGNSIVSLTEKLKKNHSIQEFQK